MGTLKDGARQAIHVCLGLKRGENVTIITDRGTLEIGKAMEDVSREITDDVDLFVLEDFGKRPLRKVPDKIRESVGSADVSVFAAQKIGNEVHTIRKPIRILGLKHGRHVNMPGVTRKVFETGMVTDHRKVWRFSGMVFGILKGVGEIRVKSYGGTDISLTFSKKTNWINSPGDMRKKGHAGTNLPGAEVYTCPEDCNGVFVADVEMGDYLTGKYGFLDRNPVRLEIRNGRVVSIECDNKELREELDRYMKTDDNANRIGEFAVGTNPFLKEFIGAFVQDEKVPGVHIAIGNPYPEVTGAGFTSRVHLDCITKYPTVWADGKKIMEKGKYVKGLV
jgi:aminopeptidase